ncbi:Hypothetical Protein FCC1311_086422 [Hondaea fermentalgiana]|uniref:WW domain-containing protein n=1 Tax=Hondaea fermentalgiana TaxID=2315210 RepID=A0A2R5GNE5_9STRA|nr:Hypothetical Protein FCC1311_086422 [Hondaea fermentalgiana]|eukprot:GBG32417.1 Hypothetical Protein FCC1311_086422 [Hondaea fermentalgiana]
MPVPSDTKNEDRAPETDEDQLAADIAAEFAEVADDTAEPTSPETAWCQVWDPISSSYYYYNYVTQVSQFEIPAELQVARENNIESEDHGSQREGGKAAVIGLLASSLKSYPPELRAVLRIQGTFRSKQARRAVRKVRAQQHVEKKDVSASAVSHWHKLQDPASGADYFYHDVTQEVSWTLPEGETLAGEGDDLYTTDSRDLGSAASQETDLESVQENVAGEWIELFDPATGRNYYFNSKTQASQWDKPASFHKFSLEDIGQKLMPPEVRAAVLVQNTWRAKVARRVLRKQRGLKLGAASPKEGNDIGSSPWQVLTDPQTGFDYFYNTETQEVTWDAPQDIAKALSSTSWTWVELIDPANGETEAESEMEEDTEGEARAAGLSEEAAQRLRMAEVSSVINKQRFNVLQKLSEAAVGAGTILEERKSKSIKQSVRVAELAAEEAETLLEKVASASTTSAKEEELPEAVKAVVFCEAQQMLATKAIFALHCALLEKSLAKLAEIGRLIKDNELATSRTLAMQEDRVTEAVELAQLRTKHVQIFSHRNSVSEAVLQERWTKVRRSGRSRLVVYTTRYYSRRISKLEAEEYEEAFAKTLAAARENAEGFDSELGFIVDKIEGSSPWWPTYKAAMSATLDVWTQVVIVCTGFGGRYCTALGVSGGIIAVRANAVGAFAITGWTW